VKSHIGGYFYFGDKKSSLLPLLTNSPLLCHSTIIKHVVSFIAEDEFGAVFVNAKTGTVTRTKLNVDGWYIGPALDHYRCYRDHIADTISDRVVYTIEFSLHA
jgi:hypothetical protein